MSLRREQCLGLALKMAFFRAFPRESEYQSAGAISPEFMTSIESIVMNKASMLCTSAPSQSSNSTIEDILQQEVSAIRAETLARNTHPALAQRFDEFETLTHNVHCSRSGGGAHLVQLCSMCNRDLPLNGSCCLRFLPDVFALARDVAVAYYRNSDVVIDSNRVSFSTGWIDPAYRAEGMPSDIHAFPNVDTKNAAVRLSLKPRAFDRATDEVLLYLLLHEWVCHGVPAVKYLSSFQDGSYLPEPAPDPFAEGWMDHIAFLIFARVAGAPSQFPAARKSPCEIRSSVRVHEFRTEASNMAGELDPNSPRREARTAAENVISEAIDLVNDISRGQDIGIDLSLKLNVSPSLTLDDRERLVKRVRELFPGRGKAPGRTFLEHYRRSRDAEAFVRHCL